VDAIVPPSLDDVPADLREALRNQQTLDDDALWAIARSRLTSTEQARLEVLLACWHAHRSRTGRAGTIGRGDRWWYLSFRLSHVL